MDQLTKAGSEIKRSMVREDISLRTAIIMKVSGLMEYKRAKEPLSNSIIPNIKVNGLED